MMDNYDLLQMKFPNRLRLSLREVCQVLGISEATARNQICLGKFPIPVIKDNHRNFIHVSHLANYLNDQFSSLYDEKPRRRGRPRKAEQKARHQAQK